MQQILSANTSWRELLCAPPAAAHLLQLYDNDDFLASAVAHFAAEGLKNGEAVLLSSTPEHGGRIRRAIESAGVDVAASTRNGQLVLGDLQQQLSVFVAGHSLDERRFEAACSAALGALRAAGRFAGARWWGEMTTTLIGRGEREAGIAAERLADAVAKSQGATVFCSYPCDRYDASGYGEELTELCCIHSHVIPADDYVRHRLAVNRAVAEVVGELKGSVLQSLTSWHGLSCSLPSSQALLFWLREAMPERFEAVLERARQHARDEELH